MRVIKSIETTDAILTYSNITEDEYRELFKGSAVKRAKYKGLKRNIDAVTCINKEKKLTLYPKQQDYDKKSE